MQVTVATATADTRLTLTARATAGAIHTTVTMVGSTDRIMTVGIVDGLMRGMTGMAVADSLIQDTSAAGIAADLRRASNFTCTIV
jgi:hypothetical protein